MTQRPTRPDDARPVARTFQGVDSPYWSESRAHVADLVPDSARRVLDVGCNDGTFGAGLKARVPGREVWGIEPHDLDAAAAAQKLTGVACGFYPDALKEVPGAFDCVSFNHVLEHMTDPWHALRVTRERLHPGGVIVGELPNIRHLPFLFDLAVRGRFDYVDSGLLDRTHLRFFTRSSAHDLFATAGYEVEEFFPVVAMGNARFPRASRVVAKAVGDLSYLAFAFRARPV
ncbi:bifunctional 2-polyprenyl-6-hydroxyphenol methylase/3-demethylubiquinol 3-O-methyltransferase UbiG [Nocardioides sp. zg-1228]|uniref:class I SAM-dependent methyltransferase n=1 Tax=Nocardioides sp. zg-1228 TaxID=2763008 RepID=UPI00164294A0|nr:class I SAM-dependent methyltransferase [Nocardioides sp. zg-1228]MBC2933607.1 class I SAM-dependent methyltransferase [Nocardioides sp. zg-1228]QSF56266.1 class I SAM-dependent methyltransferase [Nocardioides sp. zg-1228]